jgi:hypothetical protein
MSQISDQAGEVLQGTVPDGAIQGGAAATPAGGVGEGSPQAAGQQDELGFRIPKHVIPKEYGADWAAAFRDAKEYKAADAEGFSEIRRQAKARGITPGQLMQYIEQGLQPPAKAPAEAPRQAPGVIRKNMYGQIDPRGQFDENGQPLPLDPNDDPVLKEFRTLKERVEAFEKANAESTAQQKAERQQQAAIADYQRSEKDIAKAITEVLGIKPSPVKRAWLGQPDQEVDRPFSLAHDEIYSAVVQLRTRLGPSAPSGYPTAEEIAYVASELKGDYQTADLEAAGRVADQRKHLPKGAPPRGSGGGPSRKAQPAKNIDELGQRWEAELANER